jgi:hypothetical protein
MNAKKLVLVSAVFFASLVSEGAYAWDLMQDFFGCNTGARCAARVGVISDEDARFLDGAHAAMGKPLDRAAEGMATYIAPGSVQMYYGVREMGRNFSIQPPMPQPGYYAQPSMPQYGYPPQVTYGGRWR